MQVNFFATFRSLTGKKSVLYDLPENTTVFQLLQVIAGDFPNLKKRLFDENDALLTYVHLFVNGRDIMLFPQVLQTPLDPQDKIDIFPPVAGG